MHAKKFLDGLFGSSLIHVAWFEIACGMLGRDGGFPRLLSRVNGLRLFDFVRLLVHADNVRRRLGGVNGAEGVAASVSEWIFLGSLTLAATTSVRRKSGSF